MLLNVLKLITLNVCLTLAFVCIVGVNSNAQTIDTQNIQSLINEAESKRQEFAAKLEDYKYTLKRSEQEFSDKNEAKPEKISIYQVFPGADGMPIQMLVSENGVELTPERLVKEKKRVNKLWEKAKRKVAKRKDKNNKQEPMSVFLTSDFSAPRMESHMGREMVVLKFSPKPIKGTEKFMSQLEGEVWIDLKDKSLAKVDARLSDRYKVLGAFIFVAYLEPGTSLVIENAPLLNGIWAMTLLDFKPITKGSRLVQFSRINQREERTDYVFFDKTTAKVFTGFLTARDDV